MGGVANIIEGHLNELFPDDRIEEIAKGRLSKCDKCPAMRVSKALGKRCSPKQLIKHIDSSNPDLPAVLRQKGLNFKIISGEVWVYGCGCRLGAKTRTPNEECPAGKWLPVFE